MAGMGSASFDDVNLTEESKDKGNSNDKRLVSKSSEEHLDIPLSCFDKFKKMVYSKEEWEAYLIEKLEKLNLRRLKESGDK